MRKKYTTGAITLAELIKNAVPNNGCLEWTGAVQRNGYGCIRRDGKLYTVTRLILHLTTGIELSGEWLALHHCDNPRCINENHLYVGTLSENVNDKVKRKRHNFGRRVWKARLSEDDIREVFDLHAAGVTKKEIARKFDIAYSSIWRILNKQAWKHVTT